MAMPEHTLSSKGRSCSCMTTFLLLLLTSGYQGVYAFLSPGNGAPNPLAGQGLPPEPYTTTDFPVNVWALVTQLMDVDETNFKFEVTFIWLLYWEDHRAMDLIMNNTYPGGCTVYCATKTTSTSVNRFGQESCCDGVYIPQTEAANLVEFNVQSFPLQYQINTLADNQMMLYALVQGWFTMALDYRAYPFDTHYLCVDLQTSFAPQINLSTSTTGAGFTLLSGFVTASQNDPLGNITQPGQIMQNFRPALTQLGLPGWHVGNIVMDLMNFTNFVSISAEAFINGGEFGQIPEASYFSPGVRFCVEVSRVSVGFYVIIVILPVGLIMLFSFGMFSLHRREIKSRINLLATLFLTLIILQFVLQTILPGAFSLISPYILILVSYIYTFLLFAVCVVSFTLHTQNLRRDAYGPPLKGHFVARPEQPQSETSAKNEPCVSKHIRRAVQSDFSVWKQNLLQPMVPASNSRQNDEESVDTPMSAREGESQLRNISSIERRSQTPLEDAKGRPACAQVHNKHKHHSVNGLIFESDSAWYERQQSTWYFRSRLLMNIQLWWRFIGKHESRSYGEYVAHQFDTYARIGLIITYIIIVLVIFVIASSQSQDAARLHVFES